MNPDVLSLQFVPFAFECRGLPWSLGSRLSQIGECVRWHVMCHELWLDQRFPMPLRHRILGLLQKAAIASCLKTLRPAVVTTSIKFYQSMLQSVGVGSDLLPLHGNIQPSASREDGRAWLTSRGVATDDDLVAGFFGNIYPTLDFDKLGRFILGNERSKRQLRILSAGSMGEAGHRLWREAEMRFGAHCSFAALGRLTESEVSLYLSALDLGLTSYPHELAGKSGAAAAMLEHNVPVRPLGRLAFGNCADNLPDICPSRECGVGVTASRMLEFFRSRDLRSIA